MRKSFDELDIDSLIAEVDKATAVEPLGATATADQIVGWIQRRVAKELGTDAGKISAIAPITKLGVTSIQTLTITGALAEALGRELPNTLLWNHPTIASVAAFLGSDADKKPDIQNPDHRRHAEELGLEPIHYDRLFAETATWASTRAGNGFFTTEVSVYTDTTPIFWIGDYKGCHPLSLCLNQSVYALPSGYRMLRHTAENVRALAQLYAWEISEIVPEGNPFVVASYCFGGKLAMEVARVLSGLGRPPKSVVLIESAGPDLRYWKAYRTWHRLERIGERVDFHAREITKGNAIGQIGGLAARLWKRRIATIENEAPKEQPQGPLPDAKEETNRHWEYQPEPFDLPLVLVFAKTTQYRIPLFPQFGWRNHLVQPPRWEVLPGDHHSILESRDVGPLAELLAKVSAEK